MTWHEWLIPCVTLVIVVATVITQIKLIQIHTLVNSKMSEALRTIARLEARIQVLDPSDDQAQRAQHAQAAAQRI